MPPPVTVTVVSTSRVTAESSSSGPTIDQGAFVLGPNGIGKITLGMNVQSATTLGLFVSHPNPSAGCVDWTLPEVDAMDYALFSPTLGLTGIYPKASADVRTPEGMKIGWTAAQVHAVYPNFKVADAHDEDGGPWIAVPGNKSASYHVGFDQSGRVVRFALLLTKENCFG